MMDWSRFWWILLFAPPHFKILVWIFLSCTGQCSYDVCQPLLAGERFRLHEHTAGVHGSMTGTRTETVSSTNSQCQVSDINNAKLCYTRDKLLSWNNNQPDLSRDVIFRLKGLNIGYRLPRVRLSRGGRRKQKHIKVCLGNRCDHPLDPLSVPGAHCDQTVMPIVEPAVPVPRADRSWQFDQN